MVILYKNPVKGLELTEDQLEEYKARFDTDKCPICDGYGRIYDDRDYDVIEGFKLANRKLTCTGCGGNGKIEDYFKSEEALIAAAEWAKDELRKELRRKKYERIYSQYEKLYKIVQMRNDRKEYEEFFDFFEKCFEQKKGTE